MAECTALAPLLCVPPFPAVCPCSDFYRTDFAVLSCPPPPRRYDEPGRVPRRDYPEVSNALFISRTSSSTLRKLSSRPVSSQDTDPCQLVFWRKSTDTVKVASLPVAVCSPAGTAARWEDVRKDRTAVKDWGEVRFVEQILHGQEEFHQALKAQPLRRKCRIVQPSAQDPVVISIHAHGGGAIRVTPHLIDSESSSLRCLRMRV